MAREIQEPLTPAEWKVMNIAWGLRSFAARDAYHEAGHRHEMSVSTVKTHLRRLVDKGYLTATRVGNSFLYRVAQPALGPLLAAADRLLENTHEGTTGPLLAYMLEKSQLTQGEVAELRALLERHGDEEAR
jgi:predicted transcriptional regulator